MTNMGLYDEVVRKLGQAQSVANLIMASDTSQLFNCTLPEASALLIDILKGIDERMTAWIQQPETTTSADSREGVA